MRALNKWDRHKSRTTHDKEVRGVQWYQSVSLWYTYIHLKLQSK